MLDRLILNEKKIDGIIISINEIKKFPNPVGKILESWTGKNKLNFADVNLKDATMYAAEDADVTLRLFNFLKNRLDQE